MKDRVEKLEKIVGINNEGYLFGVVSKTHSAQIDYLLTRIRWFEDHISELQDQIESITEHLNIEFVERSKVGIKEK